MPRRSGGTWVRSAPFSITRPLSAASSPAMILSSVVLPLPERPSTLMVCSAASARCTSDSTASLPKRRLKPSTRNSSLISHHFEDDTPLDPQQYQRRYDQQQRGDGGIGCIGLERVVE